MEITGILSEIGEKKQYSEKLTIQEFFLDCSTYEQGTGRKFENVLRFQILNSKIEIDNEINLNDRIKVYFRISGRWSQNKEGQMFHNQQMNIYKIEKL